MSSFTLDDIRAAAESKYGSTDITVGDTMCRLINPLQLPKGKRKELLAVQELISADGESEDEQDQEDLLKEALRIVSQNDSQAETLVNAIGDNLAVLVEVFERYMGEQEVGEASASAA